VSWPAVFCLAVRAGQILPASARLRGQTALLGETGRVRIILGLLCVVVIASAAVTAWTRAALTVILGPQLTSVCLWIAAGGSLCAVITLVWMRRSARRRRKPLEPPARYVVRGDRDRRLRGDRPGDPLAGTKPGSPRDMQAARSGRDR
jgi:hypothetical protein